MTDEEKDQLSNDSKLTPISLEFFDSVISLNNIHFNSQYSKEAPIVVHAGSVLSSEEKAKYKSSKFLMDKLFCFDTLTHLSEVFEKWKSGVSERDKLLAKAELILLVKRVLQDDKKSILHVCYLFYLKLNFIDEENILKRYMSSTTLFHRSFIVSTLTVISALLDGVNDYDFIRDLYNVSFYLDDGLAGEGEVSLYIIQACEKERTDRKGQEFLEDKQCGHETMELFLAHPIKSYELLNEQKEKFNYPELMKLVLFHHEKKDGTGFPEGHNHQVLSSAEKYINFCDSTVEFKPFCFETNDFLTLEKSLKSTHIEGKLKVLWGKFLKAMD